MVTVDRAGSAPSGPLSVSPEATLGQRKITAVKWWAVVGVGFLALQIYVYSRWLLAGPERTSVGDNPTEWMKYTARMWEIAGVIAMVCFLYFVLIKPWRRDGRMSLNGVMCLVTLTLYWQDSLIAFFGPTITWNAHFVNVGAWYEYIPGWVTPNGNKIAEPLVAMVPMYIYLILGAILVGVKVMKMIRERFPRISTPGLVLVAFCCFVVFDFIIEPLIMATGFWCYTGSVNEFTLYNDQYWNFPVYEGILFPACWTAWSAVLYFKDDKGRTVAERGIDTLPITRGKSTFVRFLALTGLFNTIYLAFSLSWAVFGLYGDSWNEEITKRTNLVNEICGPGTDYACSSEHLPINRPGAIHFGPDGQLVIPDGAELPGSPGS